MKNPLLTLSLLSSVALLSMNAGAAIISVNFDTGNIDSSTLGGAPGVRVANWNPWGSGNTTFGDDETVVDSTGATVPGFTVASTATGRSQRGATTDSNDVDIFRSIIDISGTSTFAVAGLNYATYDVYVYMHDDANDRAGSFAIGSTTYYMKGIGGSEGAGDPTNTGSGYVLSTDTTVDLTSPGTISVDDSIDSGNYVKFSGLTGSSFSLVAAAVDTSDGANRNKIAGFQIVQVPEPSSMALVMLGFGGLLLKRRRG